MNVDPILPGLGMAIASLAVFGLLFHYLGRVGRRYDMLCLYGLIAVGLGLLAGSMGFRDVTAPLRPVSLFTTTATAFGLCCVAFVIWREGLRRFRETR